MRGKSEKGSALVVALIAVAVLFILATGALALARNSVKSSEFWVDKQGALYAAESGLNETLYQLKYHQDSITKSTYPDGPPSISREDGFLNAESGYRAWVFTKDGQDVVVAQGWDSKRQVTISATLDRALGAFVFPRDITETTVGRPYYDENYAANPARFSLATFNQDSSEGTLELDHSDSQVISGNPVYLDAIDLDNKSRLEIAPGSKVIVQGDMDLGNKCSLVMGEDADLHVLGALNFGNSTSTSLSGNNKIYVGSDLSVENSAQISTDGIVDIFVVGDIFISSHSTVGTDAYDTVLYLHGDYDNDFVLENNATFRGGIFAPEGDVSVINHATLIGAVVGSEVEYTGDAVIQYDESLLQRPVGEGTSVVTGSWTYGGYE